MSEPINADQSPTTKEKFDLGSHFLRRHRQIQSKIESLGYGDAFDFTRYQMPDRINGIRTVYIYVMPILILYIFILLLLFDIRFHLLKT